MTRRIFLQTNDLIMLNNYSPSAASREMQFIRAVLNKKTIEAPEDAKIRLKKIHQKITIREFCELYDLDEKDIREKLNIQ